MQRSALHRLFALGVISAGAFLLGGVPANATEVLGQGNQPQGVTDVDGVTYVVWDRSNPGSNDTVEYCRIPRGAVNCEAPAQTLALPAGCIKFDTKYSGFPQGDRPEVLVSRFGDVRVVTHGFCDTPPSGNATYTRRDFTIVYTSTDGGATFDGGVKGLVRADPFRGDGDQTGDDSDVLYDDADSRLVVAEANSNANTGPKTTAAGIYILGNDTASEATGRLSSPTGPEYDVQPTIAQRGRGSFVAAWLRRPANKIHLRTFDCVQCPLTTLPTASAWNTEQALPDTEPAENPRVVSGPNGTFLFYYTSSVAGGAGPYGAWWVRKITGETIGPRQLIVAGSSAANLSVSFIGDALQDPATGRLHLVFERSQPNGQFTPSVLAQVYSDDLGATWSQRRDVGTLQVSLKPVITGNTGDQGFYGFVLSGQQTSGFQTYFNYPIKSDKMPGWGDAAPAPIPTPPDGGGATLPDGTTVPAPPAVTTDLCRTKAFGPLEIVGNACLEVTKDGVIVAKGSIKVNGLELAGKEIRFDPKKRIVDSLGNPITFTLGDTRLFTIPIDWKLPSGSTFNLPNIPVIGGPLSSNKLFGFPLQGSADVKLVRGGVEIPLHLGLPKLFGGFSGDVTVRADNLAGLRLRELKVKAGKALIGPLEVDDLFFEYNPDDKRWAGGATLLIPPKPPSPALSGKVAFAQGELEYLKGELTFPGSGIPLDTFKLTHLTKIRFGLETKPALKLIGGVSFGAGEQFGAYRAVEVDGDMSFTFPQTGPSVLRADGLVKLVSIPVGRAYMQYKTDGQVNFGGSFDYTLSEFGVRASIDGWVLPPKAFSAYGKASVCLGDLGCARGDMVVSSKGLAACAYTKLADFGAGYEWGPSLAWTPAILFDIDYMFTGCDVSPYQPAAPSAAQTGASRSVQIEAGLPFAVFRVVGTSAAPHIALVSPTGRRIAVPNDTSVNTESLVAFHVDSKNTTFVAVKKPAAGRWKIEQTDDATTIQSVGHGQGLPKPKIKAVVGGKGAKRTLTYTVMPIKGQTVRFEERGKGAGVIGTAKGKAGKLPFSPASGPKGKRKIVAVVASNGLPRTELTVASYIAPPPPRPALPRKLNVKRVGTKLLITWKGQPGLARYQLVVTLSDGRTQLLLPGRKKASASVTGVDKTARGTVTLRGEFADGTLGPTARATVAAVRKRAQK